MRTRRPSPSLTAAEVRELLAASSHAASLQRPLNTMITLNPNMMINPPADVGAWVAERLNHLRIWCTRSANGYQAVWVRENFEGRGREHLHIIAHVPLWKHDDLIASLRLASPGVNVVDVQAATFGRNREGRWVNKAVTYVCKQMSWGAKSVFPEIYRQTHCKDTTSKVAPVLGKRCGVSTTINVKAREAAKLIPSPKQRRTRSPLPISYVSAGGQALKRAA